MRTRTTVLAAVSIAAMLALSACSSDSADTTAAPAETEAAVAETEAAPAETEAAVAETEAAPAETEAAAAETTAAAPAAAVSLKEDCPDPIVIQTDWFPESEHGALYQMIGSDYKVDTGKKVVSGSLINSDGSETGIQLEVRTGGPATGFQGPSATMATDSSITMGYSYNSEANNWSKTPLISVVAPLEKNPQIIMWDPETYPTAKTIDDLAKLGVTFNLFSKDTMLFFKADGRVDDKLLDPSYDGGPARFIAAKGKIAQQGFASAEPYSYQYEFKEWGKPVAFQLFFDAGYQDYSQTLGVRPGDLEKLRPCLKKFVPMVQRAQVDFINSPDRANAIIIDAVAQYKDFWKYTKDLADFSVKTQKELGLVGNGPDSTLGNFDFERLQKHLDLMVKSGGFKGIPEGFKIEDQYTNEFIDPTIGL